MKKTMGYVIAAVLLVVAVMFVESPSFPGLANAMKVIMSAGGLLCFCLAAWEERKERRQEKRESERTERRTAEAHNYSPDFNELYDHINRLFIINKTDAIIESLQKEKMSSR